MTPKQRHRWAVDFTARYIKRNVPEGVFVECGVKQGTSARIMASVLQRRGYLFDTWYGFPHYSEHDIPENNRVGRRNRLDHRVKDKSSCYKACKKYLKKYEVDHLCNLIRGDICKTVPKFAHTSREICFLHIDTDLYKPAYVSLKFLSPFVTDSGVIVMHDYGDTKWPGIMRVVNEFIKNKSAWEFIDMRDAIGLKTAVLINGLDTTYNSYVSGKWNMKEE